MDYSKTLSQWAQGAGVDSWVIQVFAVVFITVCVGVIARRSLARLQVRLEKTKTPWDDAVIAALRRPLGVLIWIVGLAFAVEIIQQEASATIFEAVRPMRDVGVITVIAWFLVGLVRRVEANIIAAKQDDEAPFDHTTLDAVAKLVRVSVIITAVLVALQTLGFSVSGVLAFGGIGGIAVGFAAKDLLANFFGGLMVYLDRPFAVGDWIRSPDKNIEGVVENIGWRQTRIRTFSQRPLYVPNATFTTIAVENPSRMLNREIHETVGIRYEDAGKMSVIIDEINDMLHNHAAIDTSKTMIANFDEFGPTSLDFFIYCYTKTTRWVEFHGIKQDILLTINDIISKHGAQIAFPTSTVHIPNGIPPNKAHSQAGD